MKKRMIITVILVCILVIGAIEWKTKKDFTTDVTNISGIIVDETMDNVKVEVSKDDQIYVSYYEGISYHYNIIEENPFSMAELLARIAVQGRRVGSDANKESNMQERTIVCKDIEYNKVTGCITKHGEELKLNTKEYLLMVYLLENKGILLKKKQIYDAVWNEEYMYDDNTVMVHISRIRNKIEDNPKQPEYLVTYKGIGYKLTM